MSESTRASDQAGAELEALVRADSGDGADRLPDEEELRGFYDRLRERIHERLSSKGRGGFDPRTVDLLLLAPDLFVLLVRLALDPAVPQASRGLIGGALLYFLAPIDLMPEALLGVGGFVDDVVLAVAVLSHALGPELEPLARKYWSGSEELREVLSRVSSQARSVLPARLLERLRSLLSRSGVS